MLVWLYSRWGEISWYPCFLVITQILSWGGLLAWIRLRGEGWGSYAVCLWGASFAAFGIPCFQQLNFTTTSVLAGLSGLLLFLGDPGAGRGRDRFFVSAIGLVLCIHSFLLRDDAFLLSALLWLPWWLARRGLFVGWESWRGRLGVLLVVVALLFAWDRAFYVGGDDWNGWKDYLRTVRKATYVTAPEGSTESVRVRGLLGWSLNDERMLRSWYMWDKETFSPKNLGAYSDLLGGWKGLGSLRGLGEAVLSDARAWLLILGGILGGIGLSVGRFRWLLGSIFAVVGVLSYLALFALVPERVYLPVLFFPLFLACVLSAKEESRGLAVAGRRVMAALFIVGCLGMAWFAGMKWSGLNRFFRQEVAYLRQNPERLNLVWGSAFPYELGRCWADERLLDGLKIFQMSYLQRTGLANEILVREGLRNPLRDMVDQDDSVLICLPSQGVLAPVYLKERFDMETRGARVYKGPLFYVYRLVLDRNVSKKNPRP